MNRIWQKYFLKELMKVFFLFIFCFYFLYVFIDYASHAKSFGHEGITFLNIVSYYLFQFTKRAEVLVPVALMIAAIKVMTTANVRNEVVALASSGVSLKKIIFPFLIAATICALFLYLNFQYLYPLGLSRLNAFEENFFHEKDRYEKIYPVHQLRLEDNSILVYQSYNTQEKAFFDVFWIKQANEFYRIKMLYPHPSIPLGHCVDYLVRNKNGDLIRANSFGECSFPTMKFDQKTLFTAVTPASQQSLNELFKTVSTKKFSLKNEDLNDREAQVVTHFFYKISMPLICFLVIISTAPFCLRFGRNHPTFLIYSLSLSGLIIYFTLLHSGVILGESKVLSPMVAILSIPAIFTLFFGWKFSRL